ncbi:MAG: 16S rRNA (cytosine(1402)-N(4))-methyltransferase RsmH [Streptococcaceae bacterium]|jgi:16S rRNA (cytosine1402-N4)-methyltransferase|nr:16S rRNA (cytosine(1402)-N(4))-methyltransferase RsmH [Streptococcaceae bacterium]
MNFEHASVLLYEAVEALAIRADGIYVDATFGRGGHSARILEQLTTGKLIVFDQDQAAKEHALVAFEKELSAGKVIFIKSNFRNLREKLHEQGFTQVDGILYDLGVSSPQFDDSTRGFSYKLDAKLDMRMDTTQTLSAYTVVNNYAFHELLRIFSRYGESKFAKQIARKIEQQRAIQPIETTTELAELIKSALPQKELKKKGHPAKTIFQALRIEVNDELGAVSESLEQAFELLSAHGRLAVITFHSLEDRLVKQLFKEQTQVEAPRGLPVVKDAAYKRITRQPISASEAELARNNRAHSAKLRVIERIN